MAMKVKLRGLRFEEILDFVRKTDVPFLKFKVSECLSYSESHELKKIQTLNPKVVLIKIDIPHDSRIQMTPNRVEMFDNCMKVCLTIMIIRKLRRSDLHMLPIEMIRIIILFLRETYWHSEWSSN